MALALALALASRLYFAAGRLMAFRAGLRAINNPVQAFEVPGYLDMAYIDGEAEVSVPGTGETSASFSGFNTRVLMPVGDTAFLYANYSMGEGDESDFEARSLRVGPGLRFRIAPRLDFMVRLDYLEATGEDANGQDVETDGFGGAVMFHYNMAGQVAARVQHSYFELDQSGGQELQLGLDVKVSDTAALTLSYQAARENIAAVVDGQSVEADGDSDVVRLGLRLWFLA